VNLLEPGGGPGCCSTLHAGDWNAELKRSPIYRHFRRAVGDDLEPIWPEKWSRSASPSAAGENRRVVVRRGFRLRSWPKTMPDQAAMGLRILGRKWRASQRKRDVQSGRASQRKPRRVCTVKTRQPLTLRRSPGRSPRRSPRIRILAVDPASLATRSADASALVTLEKTSDTCVRCWKRLPAGVRPGTLSS